MTAQPLPVPETHRNNSRILMWTDEVLFGHRFHNEQAPWLLLLEFLAVVRHRHNAGMALAEPRPDGEHERVTYDIPRYPHLRYLVFNNPHLQHIEETVTNNEERWRRWREVMAGARVSPGFDYLKDRFGDFTRFARVVEFFQNTAVYDHRQRRWSSRFIFPYGPDCIHADTDGKGGIGSPDRLFFARGGELLYLMLNRSGYGEPLAEAIASKLLRPETEGNRLACALQPDGIPPDPSPVVGTEVGYLPYAQRPEYAPLAEDWLALLATPLPGAALLDPLMRITGLHLVRYLLRRSKEELGESGGPRMVLEIAAPRRTHLFDLSRETYDANRVLPRRAVEGFVQRVRGTSDWTNALDAPDPSQAAFDCLRAGYAWKPKDRPGGDPNRIFEEFRTAALDRHGAHTGKVPPDWSRAIGLATSRRGMGTWYSPDDAFLKALIMSVVAEREEYHRFLSKIYERYGLVVGVTEAEQAYGFLPTDERAFVENATRLEQRLRTLGVLTRLSDDCAYVTNPFKAST